MDIDFRVVKTSELPPRFRPPTGRKSYRSAQRQVEARKSALPDPFRDVLGRATEELTDEEEIVLLNRLETGLDADLSDPGCSQKEWKSLVANGLKREANRFMAAAARMQQEG